MCIPRKIITTINNPIFTVGIATLSTMKRHIIAIASLVALGYGADVDNSKLDPLQFKKDGTFQIAIFSDMHFGQCEFPQLAIADIWLTCEFR